jgi:peptidyl-prolyl cis-trans isomerase C
MSFKRIVVGVVCAAFFACKPSPPPVEAVAKVNGKPISKTDFEAQVERNMARYRGQSEQLPPGIEQRIKESVLRRMIDDAVIVAKAEEQGVKVTDEEVNTKFQEHKTRFRTDKAFEDFLKRSHNTVDNMKSDLRRNLLRDRVVERLSGPVDVTDEENQKYYEENKERFKEKEQVKARRILIRVAQNASADDTKKAEKLAKRLRAQAAKAGSDFMALAKEHSKGPEAGRGGDLGWFGRGRMPAEFEAAVFAAEAGQVTDVIKTRLGYEIVKVEEKKPERQRPFDEVKENIRHSLTARRRNEKRRDVLRELKQTAKVERLVKFEPAPTKRPASPPRPKVATPQQGEPAAQPAPAAQAAPAPGLGGEAHPAKKTAQ